MKKKSKYTNDVLYYGLWQNTEDVDKILDELKDLTEKKESNISTIKVQTESFETKCQWQKVFQMSEKNKAYSLEKLTENLKKFIQDAAEGPLEERTNHKNPQFVGKK